MAEVSEVSERSDRTRAAAGLRVVAGAGGALAYLAGLINGAALAYESDGSGSTDRLAPALLALAVAALVAAYVAWDVRDLLPVQVAAAGAATAALLLGAFAPLYRSLDTDAATAWGSVVLLLALAALVLTPAATAAWRAGPLAVVGVGFAAAVAAVAEPLAEIAAGALGWLETPWSADAGGSARELLTEPWTGSGLVPVTLAVLTAAAALAAWRLRSGLATVAAGALGTAAAIALPVAVDVPHLAAVLAYVAVGGALLVAATRLYATAVSDPEATTDPDRDAETDVRWAYDPMRTASSSVLTAVGLAVAGGAAALFGLAWALATSQATAWALVVALAAAAAAHLADPRADRPAPVAAGVLLLVGEVCALAKIGGAHDAGAGFAGVLVAALIAVAAAHLPGIYDRPHERLALEITATAGGAMAFMATLDNPIWTSNALLAGGTAAALVALLPDRRPVAWLSGVLVTASSWVRLAEANVETPEAYTTGPALALLVAGWWNRRGALSQDGEETTARSSWAAYAPGLTMGLLPSLAQVAADAGDGPGFGGQGLERPLLLGLAALAALLVGARARLQAPLLVGAGVLATDAVILLAPYADAIPRWVSIGAAGILLLVLGATYEKRLRDLRRLRDKIDALA